MALPPLDVGKPVVDEDVAEAPVVELLDPKPGERILKLPPSPGQRIDDPVQNSAGSLRPVPVPPGAR